MFMVYVLQLYFEKNNETLFFYFIFSSMQLMTELMHRPLLAEFFKQQQVLLRHALPLGAYLLKPVQRILKYHLLLEVRNDNQNYNRIVFL